MATAKAAPKARKKAATKVEGADTADKAPKAAKTTTKASKAKSDSGPSPRNDSADPPPSPLGGDTPPFPPFESMLSPDQLKMVETLSANLARAAVTAQGAIAEAALRQADRPAALTPDPFHVAPALNEVMTRRPITVREDALAAEALRIFNQRNIDDLIAINVRREPVGLVDLQDLPKLKLV